MKYNRSQLRVIETASGKEQIVCNSCLTDSEWEGISDPKVIVQAGDMANDDAYFCDRCGKRILSSD